MAQYVKNNINFHGARSKTRVVEPHSANKNKRSDDDGWGSVPNRSVNNNVDDGWGDIPSNSSINDNAWEQDRLVHGKSERNRRFRMSNDNGSFRVPIQSVPNWEEADAEFPSIDAGNRDRSHAVNNVWEKRKQKFEEKAAIEPTNETEEEMMIRQALELSMKEAEREEERRRALEEEYRLQNEILEAHPDMFNEFRADQSAAGFDEQFPGICKEDFQNDEKVNYDQCAWGYSGKKNAKEKENTKNEDLRKAKEDFPRLKPSSVMPSFNGSTQSQTKISKVVEMFGGWGTPKPFSHQNAVTAATAKPPSKPSQWETVDTNFVPLPSKKTVVEEKPVAKSPTPPSLEVKLDNTSNWDTVDITNDKSNWDSIDTPNTKSNWDSIDTPNTKSNWDSVDPVNTNPVSKAINNLGTRDTFELNLKDCEPGYALDQKEKEFETQSKRKKSKPKLGLRTLVKGNDLAPEEDRRETSVQKVDQWLEESCDKLASVNDNQNDSVEFHSIPYVNNAHAKSQVSGDVTKPEFGSAGAKSKVFGLESEIVGGFDKSKVVDTTPNFEAVPAFAKSEPVGSFVDSQSVGARANSDSDGAGAKSDLLKKECPDSQKSVECDYAFLLNQIDAKNTNKHPNEVEEKVHISDKNSLPEIYHTTFNIDDFLSRASTNSPIPEPVPFSIAPPSANNTLMPANTGLDIYSLPETNATNMLELPQVSKEAQPLRTFGGYSTDPDAFKLPSPTDLKETPSLPIFPDLPQHNPVCNNVASHIEPLRAPGPVPELANPAFCAQPRPMMNPAIMSPMMNPAFMMGMNPLLMQQMMMLSNPFYQELQRMSLYYNSLGMPVAAPVVPMFPQPMQAPVLNVSNYQVFNSGNMNLDETTQQPGNNVPPGPIEENHPTTSLPTNTPANQTLQTEPNKPEMGPPFVEQPATQPFWFEDYMSSEPVIPPPVPTKTEAPAANPQFLPETFASMSLQGTETFKNPAFNAPSQGLPENAIPYQPTPIPRQSPDVPKATGWGDLSDGKSENSSGWNDSVDGWGDNDTTTKSMRNSSRYGPENRATAPRQPTSRPNLRRPKS